MTGQARSRRGNLPALQGSDGDVSPPQSGFVRGPGSRAVILHAKPMPFPKISKKMIDIPPPSLVIFASEPLGAGQKCILLPKPGEY